MIKKKRMIFWFIVMGLFSPHVMAAPVERGSLPLAQVINNNVPRQFTQGQAVMGRLITPLGYQPGEITTGSRVIPSWLKLEDWEVLNLPTKVSDELKIGIGFLKRRAITEKEKEEAKAIKDILALSIEIMSQCQKTRDTVIQELDFSKNNIDLWDALYRYTKTETRDTNRESLEDARGVWRLVDSWEHLSEGNRMMLNTVCLYIDHAERAARHADHLYICIKENPEARAARRDAKARI